MSNGSRRIVPPLPGSMFTSKSIEDKENLPLNNYIKVQSRRHVEKRRSRETGVSVNDSTSSISDTRSMFVSKFMEDKENLQHSNYSEVQSRRRIEKRRPIETSVNANDTTSSISDTTDHSGTTLNSSCSSQQYRSKLPKSNQSLRQTPIMATDFRSSNRVLRSGETLQSFFCITENCGDKHRRLCENIATNTEGAANDLVKWRQVLEVASEAVYSLKVHTMNSEGMNLIKLYKRAASRFPCCDVSTTRNISNEKDLLAVWLLYAKAQYKYGSNKVAHSIFQHIQNSHLGELDSNLYIELAIFELDQNEEHLNESKSNDERGIRLGKAIEIIQTGLTRGSRPVNALYKYLNKLRILEEKEEHTDEKYNQPSVTKVTDGNGKFRTIPELPRSYNGVKLRAQNMKLSKTVSVQSTARRTLSAVDKRRPLLSRNIKALGGGAQRVCPDEIHINAPSPETSRDEKRTRLNNTDGTPPQIKKADIDYMLDWTPSRPRSKPVGEVDSCKAKAISATSVAPIITEKIGGESTNKEHASDSSSSLSHHSDTSIHGSLDCSGKKNQSIITRNTANSSISQYSEASVHSGKKEEVDAKVLKHSPCIGKILSNTSHNSSQTLSPGFKPNTYFLPIVSEDNVITINNKPFLKLGVVGKGGSCKVYRALSKDRSIVGIKKVKLAGMTKKAISGYANEIALLKRLRGNPAIIQMHESEIDLQQKAIFLVMELGEVDLNYVLQQQEPRQKIGMGSYSPLNMNFIRLTWQQMLSAVHCIHEERIIHGDLKPANFLFVKGALKLIDFGIAKAIQTDDTINIYRENQVGTLNYMSPESIIDTGTGENGVRVKCGRPSDVWSLGCILYQMCYKKTPFADLRMIQKLNAIVNPRHEIKYPDTIDLAAVDAMKLCLNRIPEDRAPIVGDGGLLNEHCFLHFGNR